MKSRREENAEATRAALIAAGRELFGEKGYDLVSLGEVTRAARVTTGAVYHHFANKRALFQAVAEAAEQALVEEARAISNGDPWARLKGGFSRLVDVCADPRVQRILFVEAPQVIGPEAWREIELRYAYGGMRQVLQDLITQGIVRSYPVDLIARLLLGLLREASAEIAMDGGKVARTKVAELIERTFESLKV